MTKFVNPSSAGDFACSAGELEIESESWSVQAKAGDLAYMCMLTHKLAHMGRNHGLHDSHGSLARTLSSLGPEN